MSRRTFVVAISFVMVLLLSGREWLLLPDGKFHAHFLSIGQGDTALLILPDGKQVLIDGGADWEPLEKLGKYMPFFDRTIDLLIISHDNADHLTALPEIVQRYRIGAIAISGYAGSGRHEAILSRLLSSETTIIHAHAGQIIDMGNDVTIDFLWPPSRVSASLARGFNNVSVVSRIHYQNKSILFTGDIESIAEETLVRTGADLHSDVLKVAHHGSKTSSIEAFLQKVNPSVAVISSGEDNAYGHPHGEVVDRLISFGIEVRRTDRGEDIEIVW